MGWLALVNALAVPVVCLPLLCRHPAHATASRAPSPMHWHVPKPSAPINPFLLSPCAQRDAPAERPCGTHWALRRATHLHAAGIAGGRGPAALRSRCTGGCISPESALMVGWLLQGLQQAGDARPLGLVLQQRVAHGPVGCSCCCLPHNLPPVVGPFALCAGRSCS